MSGRSKSQTTGGVGTEDEEEDDEDARSCSGDNDDDSGGELLSSVMKPKGPGRLNTKANRGGGGAAKKKPKNTGGGGGAASRGARAGSLNPMTPSRLKTQEPKSPFAPISLPTSDEDQADAAGAAAAAAGVGVGVGATAGGGKLEAPDLALGLDAWVACDTCEKWRRIPIGVAAALRSGVEWTCAMNPYAGWDACDVEQELDDEAIDEQLLKSQAAAGVNLEVRRCKLDPSLKPPGFKL